jgi:hypothetical protein
MQAVCFNFLLWTQDINFICCIQPCYQQTSNLEVMSKEAAVAYWRCCPGIYIDVLKETTKPLTQYTCVGIFNPEYLEYEAGVLTTRPLRGNGAHVTCTVHVKCRLQIWARGSSLLISLVPFWWQILCCIEKWPRPLYSLAFITIRIVTYWGFLRYATTIVTQQWKQMPPHNN